MALEIDSGIMASTECDKGFSCLSGREEHLFEVIRPLGHNVVVIDGPTPINCLHSVNYGGLHGCKCPVRVAIFRKYAK